MSPLDENIKIIEDAKASMKIEIEAKGVSVPSDLHIEGYASKIDEIASGGGTGGNLDLTGTGWLAEPIFPVEIQRIDSLESDLNYTRQKYAEWKPIVYILSYSNDKKLVYMPKIDTSNVTSMNACFYGCSNLFSVPLLNISNVDFMQEAFKDCINLVYVPTLDTSKATTMAGMFEGCSSLETVPLFNTSNVTRMAGMFEGCSSLKSVPLFDTKIVTDMSRMFAGCSNLTSIPGFKTPILKNISSMFYNCQNLKYVPELDTKYVNDAGASFAYCCENLIDLGGFKDLKASINLSWSSNLTHQSLLNVINKLGKADPNYSLGDPYLTLSSESKALLSPGDIAIATNKGWKIA